MDAVKFLKEKKRMCDSFDNYCTDCTGCEIESKMSGMHCAEYMEKYPEQTVEIVEKWSKEHPQETRLSRFLKYYPNAELNNDGTPREICAHKLGIREFKGCLTESCVDCWNTPIEEE